jgi:hypothetical protein
MTSEDKVKRVYPDAQCGNAGNGFGIMVSRRHERRCRRTACNATGAGEGVI